MAEDEIGGYLFVYGIAAIFFVLATILGEWREYKWLQARDAEGRKHAVEAIRRWLKTRG